VLWQQPHSEFVLSYPRLGRLWCLRDNRLSVLIPPSCLVQVVGGLGLPWQPAFLILTLLYFYSHYFFASGAAHIGAMFTAFLSVATALGTPPLVAALVLAFTSNLMGGITHYGIGSAPVFFGAGYVDLATWWKMGFLCSVVNLVIWLGVGGVWWKVLGIW
jgi:di/tricarboxylate transporter